MQPLPQWLPAMVTAPPKGAPHMKTVSPAAVTVASLPMGQTLTTTIHRMVTITIAPFGSHTLPLLKTSSVSSATTPATRCLSASPTTQACWTGPSLLNGITSVWSSLRPEKSCAFGTMSGEAVLHAEHCCSLCVDARHLACSCPYN